MNAFMREFTMAAKQGPRLYFEPLVAFVRLLRSIQVPWKSQTGH